MARAGPALAGAAVRRVSHPCRRIRSGAAHVQHRLRRIADVAASVQHRLRGIATLAASVQHRLRRIANVAAGGQHRLRRMRDDAPSMPHRLRTIGPAARAARSRPSEAAVDEIGRGRCRQETAGSATARVAQAVAQI